MTRYGIMQHYALGARIRTHYAKEDILGDEYNPHDVYVRASNRERCFVSALAQVGGYYPNGTGSEKILSASIQTDVHDEDFIFVAFETCPYTIGLLKKVPSLPEYAKFLEESKPAFEKASQLPNAGEINISNFQQLQFELECKSGHGGLTEEEQKVRDLIVERDLAYLRLKFNVSNAKWERASVGYTFGELFYANPSADLEESDSLGPASPRGSSWESKKKLRLYVAHETSLFVVLQSLGYPQTTIPAFASSIIVELHTSKEGPFLRFFLVKHVGTDASRELSLDMERFTPTGCKKADCNLGSFQHFWRNQTYLPSTLGDYAESACEYVKGYVPTAVSETKGLSGVASFMWLCVELVGIVFCVAVTIALCRKQHSQKSQYAVLQAVHA
ncbi:hypothetical protein BLNAU_14999 [Blattamonas nauphoetae]|uniref:Acid phosphatase n=1 Tax=Blattamonas nauphoetae TaxID=2049346 RepID=A0ABQ9XC42_9EUKA|nr:hypothetical protein BLNAU_14999 [Blattamonas nauphoetae]